jgi:hypothetical protein
MSNWLRHPDAGVLGREIRVRWRSEVRFDDPTLRKEREGWGTVDWLPGAVRLLRYLVAGAYKSFITLAHAFRNRVPGEVTHNPAAAGPAHSFPALIVFKQ